MWVARAETSSRHALSLDNRLGEARITLGLLYVKMRDYEDAIREYDLAFVLDSTNTDIYLNKAIAQEQLGDRLQALAWIEKALQNGYAREDLETDSSFIDLRLDPRYEQLHERPSPPSRASSAKRLCIALRSSPIPLTSYPARRHG